MQITIDINKKILFMNKNNQCSFVSELLLNFKACSFTLQNI